MSFRVKIALLSGLISAVLLLGTGWVLWEFNLRENKARVDRDLVDLGQGNLARRHGGQHYERLDEALSLVSSGERPFYVMSFVDQREGMSHQSEYWPENLDVSTLEASQDYLPGHEERLLEYRRNRGKPGRLGDGGRDGRFRFGDGRDGERRPPRDELEEFERDGPEDGRGPGRRGGRRPGEEPMDLPLKRPLLNTHIGPDGTEWRIAIMGNPANTLMIGADMTLFNSGMEELRQQYLLTVAAGLFLLGGGAWVIAGRALRPVNELSAALKNVHSKGLDQRLDTTGFDRDFKNLVEMFNGMMRRLESGFHQATRFSADASHELKTPLAILQGEIETALQHASDNSAEQKMLGGLLEEIQRLKSIVQKLLLLSQADTGELRLDQAEFSLSDCVENHVEDLSILAEGLKVESNITSGLKIKGDVTLMQQVIQNLFSNAVKYNRPDGSIRVSLTDEEGRKVLTVSNTGTGVPEKDREKVFDRFFRADPSRNKEVEGTGLGLSLSLEIVRAHAGTLELVKSGEDLTEFRMIL